MINRPLGKTGINVSEVAFGGVEIGMPYGIGVQGAADMITEADAIQLLHASLDSGINFFDTARQYGRSETIIGKAFRDRRDRIVLCTKCKHFLQDDNTVPDLASLKKIIKTSLQESLRSLQTDYIDVFMLHEGSLPVLKSDDVADVLAGLKKSGMIRATGVSTYTPLETTKAIESGAYDVIQLPFNLMDQRQAALFPLALSRGVGIVVRSVLMKGLLSERGKDLHPALKDVETHIRRYDTLLGGSSRELASFATKFALSFPEVSSILVGLDRMEYLRKCLACADGNYFDKSLLDKSRALAYSEPEFLNLQTWSRMGWLA